VVLVVLVVGFPVPAPEVAVAIDVAAACAELAPMEVAIAPLEPLPEVATFELPELQAASRQQANPVQRDLVIDDTFSR
jgi:hypothetical protein